MTSPLKMMAKDAEDLEVVSSVLQDALVRVADMSWRADEHQFILVANRFRWEATGERDAKGPIHERVTCGVCVGQVQSVQRMGIDPRNTRVLLNLLAVEYEPASDDAAHGHVTFTFAGGMAVRLNVSEIACQLDDFGLPWPTRARPEHPLESTPEAAQDAGED